MTYYAFSALFNCLASVALALLVWSRSRGEDKVAKSFCYFAMAVATWSMSYFLWQTSNSPDHALFFCRLLSLFAAVIPATFLHFIARITAVRRPRLVMVLGYLPALVFIAMIPSGLIVARVEAKGGFEFWPVPGGIYTLFLAYFFAITIYAHAIMFRAYRKKETYREKRQLQYVFAGTLIGFVGGSTNYFLWYDIPIKPYGNILVSVYVLAVAYAIMKYRLMDIKVAATRAFIFAVVYVPVLAAPFILAARYRFRLEDAFNAQWWVVPLVLSNILAPLGIYLYLKLKNKAEDIVLREQRRQHATLLQASQGMTFIKELNRLLQLIVHVVSRTMRLKDASVFLLDKESATYSLKVMRYPSRPVECTTIRAEDPIVLHLMHTRAPILIEEIRARLLDNDRHNDDEFKELESRMRALRIAVIVPSFIHEVLVGFLILGEKTGGQMYTQDDLNVLGVLSNQSALAIENAIFYEERGKSLAEQFHDEKLKSLGKMGSDMSHQVNNRLNIIVGASGACTHMYLPMLKEELKEHATKNGVGKILEHIEQQLKAIESNAMRGGEIAQTIMRFARKTAQVKLEPMDFAEALKGAQLLLSVRYEKDSIEISTDIPPNTPKIQSNLALLEDVLMNILSNARDAQRMRDERMKAGELEQELGYKPKIAIRARVDLKSQSFLIEIEDNGIGMTKEQLDQIFVPFFTTKAGTGKGTGLGLSIIRQMIEHLKGKIEAKSVYGKGSVFTLSLPLSEEPAAKSKE
jgi:signal transduction histidine kinase